MKPKVTFDVQDHISIMREKSLDKLTVYLSGAIVFLLFIYIHRLIDSDWQDIYFLDAGCLIIGFFIVILKNKLSYQSIVYGYLALALIVVVVEFICWGIGGMGDVTALFCMMLSLFYLNRNATVVIAVIITAIYGFAYYQFVYAGKLLSDNDTLYMSWNSSWIGTYVAAVSFFVIIGVSIYHLQSQMISLLLELERQKSIISEQNERIEHLANHDDLTGLPSSRVADSRLDEVLKQAAEKNHKSAVLFLDLDGFKAINDKHGHDAGDEMLKSVANRISSIIRSSDTACRIGGDEFLLIIERVESEGDLERLCQRLITGIGSPLGYNNNELRVGVSIGAASYPDSAKNARSLRLKADELMYRVKKSGKNNYQILMGAGRVIPTPSQQVVIG